MPNSLITVNDPKLLDSLSQETGTVELKHPNGRTIGFLNLDFPGRYPQPFTVQFPDEFFRVERIQDRDEVVCTKSLQEIFRYLEERYGK